MKKRRTQLSPSQPSVAAELVESRIFLIRGWKAMLDRDLAGLYGARPVALRQQAKRNVNRFPADLMFQLTQREADLLLSQNVIPSRRSLDGYPLRKK
jgi:ORF6N domain-containing protein